MRIEVEKVAEGKNGGEKNKGRGSRNREENLTERATTRSKGYIE